MSTYGPNNLRLHVGLDYLFVALGLVAPCVLVYSQNFEATAYTLALTLFGFGLNLVTDYPGGLWRKLPFKWHRYVEWTTPVPFILIPWLFFSHAGAMPWFLTALGVAILLNSTFTRPRPPLN